MPRVQDAIPSLDCRAWKGRSNPLLLTALRFAPESRGRDKSLMERRTRRFISTAPRTPAPGSEIHPHADRRGEVDAIEIPTRQAPSHLRPQEASVSFDAFCRTIIDHGGERIEGAPA